MRPYLPLNLITSTRLFTTTSKMATFEWKLENFQFFNKYESPVFTVCRSPAIKARLELSIPIEGGHLSAFVVFERGFEAHNGAEHQMAVLGRTDIFARTDLTETTVDGRKRVGLVDFLDLTSTKWGMKSIVVNKTLIVRYHFQPSSPKLRDVQWKAVTRINIGTVTQDFSLKFSELRSKTTRSLGIGDLLMELSLIKHDGVVNILLKPKEKVQRAMHLTARVRCINDPKGERSMSNTAILPGNVHFELPFEYSVRDLSEISAKMYGRLKFKFSFKFYEEGNWVHSEMRECEAIADSISYDAACMSGVSCSRDASDGPREVYQRGRRQHDVKIRVGGSEFYGNRAVLSEHSATFADMFQTSTDVINLAEAASPDTVRLFVSFSHNGRLELSHDPETRLQQLMDLYIMAGGYHMAPLMEFCQRILLKDLDEGNAVHLLRLAAAFSGGECFAEAIEEFLFGATDRSGVLDSDAFRKFLQDEPEAGSNILYKILTREHL